MKITTLARVRLATTLALLVAALGAQAVQQSGHDELPNFDRRTPLDEASVLPERRAAVTSLSARLPDAVVEFDELARPKWIRSRQGFLTGPSGQGRAVSAMTPALAAVAERHAATKAFLREHASLFGLGPEALERARPGREFTTEHNGLETAVWHQELDGIPVFQAVFISHTTKQGELVNLASQFIPNPGQAALAAHRSWTVPNNAPITAQQAVALAAQNIGEELEVANVTVSDAADNDAAHKQHFGATPLAGLAESQLVWLPMNQDTMRLCWGVVLTSRARGEMYRVLVDSESGEVIVRHRLTEYISDASYRVFLSDSPSPFSPGCPALCTTQPAVTSPVLVTLSALDTNASPAGWIDDGGNETRGNNVDSHTDRNADNSPDLPRPQGSPFRTFDFPVDLSLAPSTYTNAAVTDLFYWCNWMHDQLYGLGFTEAAGNFQNNNFGRGGLGNDAVQADAQDGSGENNANMSTPSDGSSPRMQMFLFTGPTPDRDGDFDHEIVLHEYTHGLSNRRVGGGVGLSAVQSRGMGEGWSDWYALALLGEAGDDLGGVYAKGGYATYLLSGFTTNYYFGIRRYPYSTDLTKNPLTFKDIDPNQASTHAGVPRSSIIGNTASEVHNQGEVWCVTLWDMRANLIAKHGFSVGNQMALRLVTDGMNLSPANPTFLQSRDAILQAELVLTGGVNRGELWLAFAKRGMGASAIAPASSTTTGVFEAYDIPDNLTVAPGTGFTSSGPVAGPFTQTAKTFLVLNTGASNLNWAATSSVGWLNLSSGGGVLTPGGSNSVVVSLGASAYSLAAGVYSGMVRFTNVTSGLMQNRTFTLRVGQRDYYTELFDGGDNDLDFQTFTFTPNGSTNFYSICRESASAFPTDPTTGTSLNVPSDNYLSLTLPTNIVLFGRATNIIYIGSAGYITLQAGDTTYTPSLVNHFRLPRIAALSLHVHPSEGGPISWQQLSNRVVVSFRNIREWSTSNTNNYQIEMFFDGRIRMTFLSMGSSAGLAGLSAGTGVPADFQESDLSGYGPCVLPLTLNTPASATEGDGVLVGQGTVRIYATNATPLTVSLTSADTSEITLPTTVTIPAGQTNATFNITIVDDADLDGVQSVNLSVAATNYGVASAAMQVNDNESAVLTLGLPASVTEGGSTVTGSIFSSSAPSANITVGLASSDTSEIVVPASVVLPAGQTSAVFNVTIVNDTQIDGGQPATITASVTNWTPGTAIITVLDNEPTNLVVTLPASAREGNGTLPGAGTVRIGGTLSSNLPVALLSSDLTELTVPVTATILAGQTTASFSITVVDDLEIDSSQPVTVTASATGFASGSTNLMVTDDESPPEPFNPLPAHLAANVIQTSDLAWSSGAMPGEVITNEVYFGTTSTPGPTELLGTTTSTSWTLPTLWPQTTYYWRIVARKTGVTPGPVWQFTTRGVDHFTWGSISQPQFVAEPFTATLTAKDVFENTVSNFNGTVWLTGSGSGGQITNNILGNLVHASSGSGSFTLGYSFTPNTNLSVTHVRSYSGTKVSIWTDAGVLLANQTVSGPNATWTDTPLASPLSLNAGTRYRVAIYTGSSGQYYWREDGSNTFSHGAINQSYQGSGDAFPTLSDSVRWWFVGLRYTIGGPQPIQISPTNLSAFANGAWSGPLTVFAPTTNLVLRADDNAGHIGLTAPLVVSLHNDLAVNVTDSPDPVSLGGNLTYAITVTNIGPTSATSVTVTNILPATVSLVSVAMSQGTLTTNGNVLLCQLNTLAADSVATINVVAKANSVGSLTNRVFATRGEADAYTPNNSAVNVTAVQTPTISINDVSFFEGNGGMSSANFVVSIVPTPAVAASVSFMTASGTAGSPSDFLSTNGVVTFSPGETNKLVSVRVVGDAAYENDETFSVDLFAPANATLSDSSALGTILNDDPIPKLSIGDATVVESNTGKTNAVFNVSLSAPSGLPVSFYVNTSDGSAYGGSDYDYTNRYFNLAVGITSTNLPIWINGELQIEDDEVFYVGLSSVSGATLLKREGIGLIVNDDGLPGNADHFEWQPIPSPQYVGAPFGVTVTALDAFDNPAVNFSGPANISVSRAGLTNVLGTGTSESAFPMYTGDYVERTQVIYPASELGGPSMISALALDVSTLPNLTLSNWTVRIKHTPLTAYTSYVWESTNWTVVCQTNLIVASTGWLVLPLTTPFNYDGSNSLMVDFSFYNTTSYGAGYCRSTWQSNTRTLYYYTGSYGNPLTWTGSSPSPFTTSYTPNLRLIRYGELTSIQPGVTGLFTNGVWSGTLTATLPATNAVLRADDGFGHAGDSSAFVVQLTDDLAVKVVDSPAPVAVGGSLTYALAVTNTGPGTASGVVLTNKLPPGVTLVSVTPSQGAYTNYGQTVVCNLGAITSGQQAFVNIVVTPGSVGTVTNIATVSRIGAEYFTANNAATNATVVLMPALTVNDVSIMEPNGVTTSLEFSVALSVASPQTVTVNYATTSGTATAGSDYATVTGTLTFQPGETNQPVSVFVFDDLLFEPVETFSLGLSGAVNANIAKAVGTASIVDNEGPPEFQILNLLTSNSKVVDHDILTSDDRGGVAISTTHAFVTGDSATARFAAGDLTGGASLGVVRDSLCTDLRTEKVYLLGNGGTPLTSSGGTVTSLIELNATGSTTGVIIPLSQSFTMPSSANGIFSGYGRIVVHNGTRVYDIYVPTGLVTDRGVMTRPNMYGSESWSSWGVAEYFGGSLYLAYRESTSQNIVRARVPDGAVSVIAVFTSLGDMASFVVSPSRNRWYFHYEGGGQFGGSSETLGYADANFVTTSAPTIYAQPANQLAPVAGTVVFNVGVSGSMPLSYQWRKNGTNLLNGGNISGATSNLLAVANVQTNDAGLYSVAITNAYGWAVSTNAALTLNIPLPPTTPFGPNPTNLATGISVHTMLSWNTSSATDIEQALNGAYGVIDTSGYDGDALSYLQGMPGLTGTSVSWSTINGSSGPSLIAAYDVIYFAADSGTTDYQLLRTAVTSGNSLERYVYLGGTLVLNLAGNAGSQAEVGPGGLGYDRSFTHQSATIVSPSHPFITGTGYGGSVLTEAMFQNWSSTDHGILNNLPAGATELLRNSDSTSMAEYAWGAGRVIASTLTLGWGGSTVRFGPPFTNQLLYAANLSAVAPVQYFVYLGTNPASLNLIATNLTESTCNPGTLQFNTTYYWQVRATNTIGSVTGAVWQFTTTLDEVRFAAGAQSVGENAGAATITVVRENPAGGALSVQYATTNGTATAGVDYTAAIGTLNFPAGVLSTNFLIPILDDGASETSETILLRLNQPSSNVLLVSPSDAVLTIVDNDALQVSVFADASYVDVGITTDNEVTNVIASLVAKGCQIRTFTGITPTAFSNALVGASVLYIPDLEIADLGSALSASARGVISNFVGAGGRIIINGEGTGRDENFLNQVFGFNLTPASSGGSSYLTGAATGTAFAGGSSSLLENNGTYEWIRASLPIGGLSIYQDNTDLYTSVAIIPRGAGKIIFLAYDWYNAFPRGTQDGGWDDTLRRALLESSAPIVPSINAPPQNQTVAAGQTASFSVGAEGTGPLSYQWRKGTVPLTNQSIATLTLLNVQSNDAGNYSVIVSNAYGSVTSSPAVLTVVSAPLITMQPASQSLSVGAAASFSVTAIGVAPLRYQWQKSGVPLVGATNSTYAITNIQTTHAGSYAVLVTNAYGSALSSNAVLGIETTQVFNFTGAPQLFVVPPGVTSINVQCFGAQGSAGGSNPGGLGGYVAGNITVTPGETVAIYVGQWGPFTDSTNGGYSPNAFNGGGRGWTWSSYYGRAGAGGGASDVRFGGSGLSNRVLVAGGGGGATDNGCSGGAAGGLVAATVNCGYGNVTGGSQVAGGIGGQNGSFGQGGMALSPTTDGWVGGGGGGYYGGACGYSHSSGAGGSSYTGGYGSYVPSTTTNAPGLNSGHGRVIINWQAPVELPALRFLAPELTGSGLKLRVTTVDASPISAARASNIWIYASTNLALPLSNWTAIAIAPVLTNGLLAIEGINPTNPPVQFFRAIEGSWNVRPLRLHNPQRSGNTLIIRAAPPDGSPLTPVRAAKVKFYSATNVALPFGAWQPVTGALTLSNGVVSISVAPAPNPPISYFRAEESP